MKALNESWHYEIDANGVVKKDAAGRFFEDYQWTHMTSSGQPVSLAASVGDYRQKLTLDPEQIPSAPDLTKVDAKLIGPITDMMTFYADLWLANKLGVLKKTGDHFDISPAEYNLAQMDCPNCKLVSPPTATRCDCGYDFYTHTTERSYLTDRDKQLLRPSAGVAGIVTAALMTLEFALRLTSAVVARHSVALGVLTVVLVAACFAAWLWLLNGKVSTRRS